MKPLLNCEEQEKFQYARSSLNKSAYHLSGIDQLNQFDRERANELSKASRQR